MSSLRYVPVLGAAISTAGVLMQMEMQRSLIKPMLQEVHELRNEVHQLRAGSQPAPLRAKPEAAAAPLLHSPLSPLSDHLATWMPTAQR